MSVRHLAIHVTSLPSGDTAVTPNQERLTLTVAGEALAQVTATEGDINAYRQLLRNALGVNASVPNIVEDDDLKLHLKRERAGIVKTKNS